SSFHGLIAVAPLKHAVLGSTDPNSMGFPRPHRRGPIEARTRRGSGMRPTPFHGLIAVAPLKRTARRPLPGQRITFHGLIAVAPLKRRIHAKSCLPINVFPRPHRRGPIEAWMLAVGVGNDEQLSTASSPWPH